jgi:hypothetical protein
LAEKQKKSVEDFRAKISFGNILQLDVGDLAIRILENLSAEDQRAAAKYIWYYGCDRITHRIKDYQQRTEKLKELNMVLNPIAAPPIQPTGPLHYYPMYRYK